MAEIRVSERVEEILRRQPMSPLASRDMASDKGTSGTEVEIKKLGNEVYVGDDE